MKICRRKHQQVASGVAALEEKRAASLVRRDLYLREALSSEAAEVGIFFFQFLLVRRESYWRVAAPDGNRKSFYTVKHCSKEARQAW